ncbi:hypothetical protein BROUX41_000278 [Berkeleyomyces rouxiae]|uniref:uncharacterized protein n=1 Tax=Berkeleyomyces rouxiae TaxID=2035830 RepID=UPI003B7AE6AB
MPRIQSSRRAPPLRDVDYDHEISLVNHDQAEPQSPGFAAGLGTTESAATESSGAVITSQTNRLSRTASRMDRLRQLDSAASKPSIGSALLSIGGAGAALGGGSNLPVPSEGSSTGHYIMAVPHQGAASVVAASRTEIRGVARASVDDTRARNSVASVSKGPELSISVAPSSDNGSYPTLRTTPPHSPDHEWVIDVLYENQRGLFLCGMPLFSAAALANLDPAPWTNAFHKPSLTDPHETQLPDPSWHWAWPEWRVNHDSLIDCDEDGWEYSFMFSSKFSWHGRTWYSSFVRRRAWTRKRIRKQAGASGLIIEMPTSGYGHMEPPGPGQVSEQYRPGRSPADSPTGTSGDRSSSRAGRSLTKDPSHAGSRGSSIHVRQPSMASASRLSRTEYGLEEGLDKIEIDDTQLLLKILRIQRVDREKLEATANYLKNAHDDLEHLQDAIHEIMGIFVFQNSRRQALAQIAQACEEAKKQLHDIGASPHRCNERTRTERRLSHLDAAKQHAEEEVRKLAYWSDVRTLENRLGETEGTILAEADVADGRNGHCDVSLYT